MGVTLCFQNCSQTTKLKLFSYFSLLGAGTVDLCHCDWLEPANLVSVDQYMCLCLCAF